MKQGVKFVDKLVFEFFKLFFSSKIPVFLKKIKSVFTFGITPLTVILVKSAVLFVADIAVIYRHSAALTYKLSWGAENSIDRNIKKV